MDQDTKIILIVVVILLIICGLVPIVLSCISSFSLNTSTSSTTPMAEEETTTNITAQNQPPIVTEDNMNRQEDEELMITRNRTEHGPGSVVVTESINSSGEELSGTVHNLTSRQNEVDPIYGITNDDVKVNFRLGDEFPGNE